MENQINSPVAPHDDLNFQNTPPETRETAVGRMNLILCGQRRQAVVVDSPKGIARDYE